MITFSDVSFAYTGGQRTDGVSHIDLTIPQGQVVLLCGASGCGKSTMTRLINGLAPHYYEGQLSGAVNVTGLDVASAEIFELALRVGSVFQNPRWAITWVCAETLYAEKSKAEASRSFFIFIYFSFWFAFKDIKSNANQQNKDANLR